MHDTSTVQCTNRYGQKRDWMDLFKIHNHLDIRLYRIVSSELYYLLSNGMIHSLPRCHSFRFERYMCIALDN